MGRTAPRRHLRDYDQSLQSIDTSRHKFSSCYLIGGCHQNASNFIGPQLGIPLEKQSGDATHVRSGNRCTGRELIRPTWMRGHDLHTGRCDRDVPAGVCLLEHPIIGVGSCHGDHFRVSSRVHWWRVCTRIAGRCDQDQASVVSRRNFSMQQRILRACKAQFMMRAPDWKLQFMPRLL